MSKTKPKQLELFALPLPANVIVIKTDDLDLAIQGDVDICVQRMLDVPMDKGILLDFLVGRRRGDPHASEEHTELHRLMALLNSRYRGRRFDFFSGSMTARLLRNSIRSCAYNPFGMKGHQP